MKLEIECAEASARVAERLNVASIDYTLVSEGGASGGSPASVDVVVKDLDFPSIDEKPIIDGIRLALASKGIMAYFKMYETSVSPREEVLASIMEEHVRKGESFIAVVPSLLAIGLASRLPLDVLEEIESSYIAEVSVSFTNLLYLPVPEVNDTIEIVGKKNSAASYERIRRLEEAALARGIKVKSHTLLNSNEEILRYIGKSGPRGLYEKIPVTKIAIHIILLSRCLDLDIDVIEVRETSRHTLYMYKVGGSLAKGILDSISQNRSRYLGDDMARTVLKGAANTVKKLGLDLTMA